MNKFAEVDKTTLEGTTWKIDRKETITRLGSIVEQLNSIIVGIATTDIQELLNRLTVLIGDLSHIELAREDSLEERDADFWKLPKYLHNRKSYAVFQISMFEGDVWFHATSIRNGGSENDITGPAYLLSETALRQIVEMIETYNNSLNA